MPASLRCRSVAGSLRMAVALEVLIHFFLRLLAFGGGGAEFAGILVKGVESEGVGEIEAAGGFVAGPGAPVEIEQVEDLDGVFANGLVGMADAHLQGQEGLGHLFVTIEDGVAFRRRDVGGVEFGANEVCAILQAIDELRVGVEEGVNEVPVVDEILRATDVPSEHILLAQLLEGGLVGADLALDLGEVVGKGVGGHGIGIVLGRGGGGGFARGLRGADAQPASGADGHKAANGEHEEDGLYAPGFGFGSGRGRLRSHAEEQSRA